MATSKHFDNIATTNEISIKQEKDLADYVSFDAPPLDFSFKNIKQLEEITTIQPRQGERKKMPAQQVGNVLNNKNGEEKNEPGAEGEEVNSKGRKVEVTRLLPANNVGSVVANLVNTSAMKNISLKAKQQLQKKKKKAIHIKLVCSSLMLSYNKLREIKAMPQVLSSVMESFANLQWIDLSHNYLVSLDYEFAEFTQLKTLYLHCNFIPELAELQKLSKKQQLKTFTIHGNPLTAIPNFRGFVIAILPQLKKLDSVLISKKEVDNARFLKSQTKKYPQIKNAKTIPKPPAEKQDEGQDQKQQRK